MIKSNDKTDVLVTVTKYLKDTTWGKIYCSSQRQKFQSIMSGKAQQSRLHHGKQEAECGSNKKEPGQDATPKDTTAMTYFLLPPQQRVHT
jgi:hypothetical protein